MAQFHIRSGFRVLQRIAGVDRRSLETSELAYPHRQMFFGIVMGLLASASWAAANVFVQKSGQQAGAFRALVWAQVVGIVALAPIAWILDVPTGSWTRHTVLWAVLAAVAAVVAYACLFFSMERGRLSVVVPVMSSWSLVAAGVSIFVLGERLRLAHGLGAGLVVLGVLIVSRFSQVEASPDSAVAKGPVPDNDHGVPADRQHRIAMIASVGAALGFGVLIPAIDQLAPVTGRLGTIPLVYLMDLVLGIPLVLMARIDIRFPPRASWVAIIAAGVFETIGFVWIALGVARAPVAIVSPLAGLASAFTVLFAWVVLRERPRPAVLLGAAMACTGVVTLAI